MPKGFKTLVFRRNGIVQACDEILNGLQSNILETEIQTAARIAKLVFDSGLARVKQPRDMVSFIREHVYVPEYGKRANHVTKVA